MKAMLLKYVNYIKASWTTCRQIKKTRRRRKTSFFEERCSYL